jgi:hypothetical protein
LDFRRRSLTSGNREKSRENPWKSCVLSSGNVRVSAEAFAHVDRVRRHDACVPRFIRLVGFNLFFHLQVKGLERIDDALDLSVPKTCFFEPRTMLVEPP